MHPIVLLDAPGGDYWQGFVDFIKRDLVSRGYAGEADLKLFTVTDDVEEAAKELATFYANYDSMRFVGSRIILRMKHAPDDATLADLALRYADIIKKGTLERIDAQPSEVRDDDRLDQERIAMQFDRMSYGRLRELIDELNQFPSPAGEPGTARASA
jgi:hypothetical protein